MQFSTPEPIKIPAHWKAKLNKVSLPQNERNDFDTVQGTICDGITFALHLNSDESKYRLDATIDDTINDIYHDSAGNDIDQETPSLILNDDHVIVPTPEHSYRIAVKFI